MQDKTVKCHQLNSYLSSLKKSQKSIVLTGGCFDVLHAGHIRFLSEAKNQGDILAVLVESDKKVKSLKGKKRPYFKQKDRVFVLNALSATDIVIPLPYLRNDNEYVKILNLIKPDVIAVTQNDPLMEIKKAQAKLINASLFFFPFIKNCSTSKIARNLGLE